MGKSMTPEERQAMRDLIEAGARNFEALPKFPNGDEWTEYRHKLPWNDAVFHAQRLLEQDETEDSEEGKQPASWILTIPKTTPWNEYKKELAAVADGSHVLNYRTRHFPKEMKTGDRCYIVHDGKVRGWMIIVGMVNAKPWTCTGTGTKWPAGKYIQRSGAFHPVDGPLMNGFRGVRKFNTEGEKA